MNNEIMKAELEQLSSEELLKIWETEDHATYKREAFVLIREILKERGVEVPQQGLYNLKSMPMDTENGRQKSGVIGSYFKFESLISPTLIRISYFIGMLIITYSGYKLAVSNSQSLTGAAIVLFGNLLWRILCEISIIFFRIHESLVSIDKKTK